jgi:hypothetical protein
LKSGSSTPSRPPISYIDVEGSTNICDGTARVVGATYSGSGLASGIKIYVSGAPETLTILKDTLDGNSIIGNNPQQFVLSNQYNHTDYYLPGILGDFSLSNVVRSQSYMTEYATSSPPVDGNTVLSYQFAEGTGTTTADGSGNGYAGTLTSSSLWGWQF